MIDPLIICSLCNQTVDLDLPDEDLIGCRNCGRGFCIRCGDPSLGICRDCIDKIVVDQERYSRDRG